MAQETKPEPDITAKSPEQIELDWYKNVYQGDNMAQLTIRHV